MAILSIEYAFARKMSYEEIIDDLPALKREKANFYSLKLTLY